MSGSKGILTSLIPNCSVLCTLIILISYHNRRNLMTGSERRQELLQLLSGTQTPISGTSLAKHFTVSRQVIVQDMALLRAQGHEVLSTNRGYLIQAPLRVSRIFKVFHTSEQIVDELCTIVDLGGTVEDVFVHHKIYGQLQAPFPIKTGFISVF